jgi:DNA polymerase IV
MNMQAEHLEPESGLRWLFVDMNSFFASCEQQDNPGLRGHPVAVAPMLVDTTCAIAASTEAKAFGIKTGTLIGEARKRCPQLKVVQARPKLYVEYHHKIREAIETCIPVDAVLSIDEVACKLDNVQHRPEVARALALSIKAVTRDRAGAFLTCSIGIAANKLLAKLASDMQKPDGLVILLPEDLPHAILHLKLQDICGIGPNMEIRLHEAGITDIAGLWAADAQYLRRIWNGVTGLRFHALLHGADLASPVNPTRSMGHQHVLAPTERTMDKATPVIRQLLTRAAQRLRSDGFYGRRLCLEIKWVGELGHHFEECRFQETQDTRFLLNHLMRMWSTAPGFKPLRVGVVLTDLAPKAMHQPDLFDRPEPGHLTTAIDRLNSRYGRGTINYGSSIPAMGSKISFQRVPKLEEF